MLDLSENLHIHGIYNKIQVSAFNAFASLFAKDIVLLYTETPNYVHIFRKALVRLNLRGIGCIYVTDEESFKKHLPKAKMVFEWGELCRKYDMRGKKYFTNIDFTKDKEYSLMQELGIRDMANYAYLDVDKICSLKTPLIAKPIAGMRTTDMNVLMSKLDVDTFLETRDLRKYVFTEYVKYGDYEFKWRIITVGDRVLWHYMTKRDSNGYKKPEKRELYFDILHHEKPTTRIMTAVEKIARYFANKNNVSFLGFDILTDKAFKEFAILEFNTRYVAVYTAEWLDAEQNISKRFTDYLSDQFNT